MGQALERRYQATGNRRYYVDPSVAILPIDALGFRRGAGAMKSLLQDQGLADMPLFAQAKARGIKALAGHAESVDVTNDVNGGPSGIGIATAAGKAAFWDIAGASMDAPKIIAFEGEFAMTEGHAQELKTQALALQTGKRLRVMISDNNAGIDDSLIGGVINKKYDGYRLVEQWTLVRLERLPRPRWQRLRAGRLRTQGPRGLGSGRPPSDRAHRQDHEGILARGGRRQDSGSWRSGGRLSQPPLRDEDELGVLRRAGQDVREALRRRVPGHHAGPDQGHSRASHSIQDQPRRRHVGARQERPGRLARRSSGRDRRFAAR